MYVCKRKSRRDQDTNRLQDIVISVKKSLSVGRGKDFGCRCMFKVMYTLRLSCVHEGFRVRNKESQEVALTLQDKCIALGDGRTVCLCVHMCVCLCKGERYPDTSAVQKTTWQTDCICTRKGTCTSNRQDTVNDEGEDEKRKKLTGRPRGQYIRTDIWRIHAFVCVSGV